MDAQPTPNAHLGPALRRTAADLDRLARVTDEDILDAIDMWHELAPDGFQGLIDAQAEPEENARGEDD